MNAIGKTSYPMMSMTTREPYVTAVKWIAENDTVDVPSFDLHDVDIVVQLPTVLLVSDLYAVDVRVVASDVVRFRLTGTDTEPPKGR